MPSPKSPSCVYTIQFTKLAFLHSSVFMWIRWTSYIFWNTWIWYQTRRIYFFINIWFIESSAIAINGRTSILYLAFWNLHHYYLSIYPVEHNCWTFILTTSLWLHCLFCHSRSAQVSNFLTDELITGAASSKLNEAEEPIHFVNQCQKTNVGAFWSIYWNRNSFIHDNI